LSSNLFRRKKIGYCCYYYYYCCCCCCCHWQLWILLKFRVIKPLWLGVRLVPSRRGPALLTGYPNCVQLLEYKFTTLRTQFCGVGRMRWEVRPGTRWGGGGGSSTHICTFLPLQNSVGMFSFCVHTKFHMSNGNASWSPPTVATYFLLLCRHVCRACLPCCHTTFPDDAPGCLVLLGP
jgi:hypothetical protein